VTQRHDIAKLTRLLQVGTIALTQLRTVRIEHEPGCPMESPQNLECRCDPMVFVGSLLVAEHRHFATTA
jgi:hypothetical protein